MIEEAIEEVIEGMEGTVKNEDLNVEEATLEEKEEMIVTEDHEADINGTIEQMRSPLMLIPHFSILNFLPINYLCVYCNCKRTIPIKI